MLALLVLSMLFVPFSAGLIEQGAQSTGGRDGSGSVILIHDVYDLQNISSDLNGSYALAGNIDAQMTKEWNNGTGFIPIMDVYMKLSERRFNSTSIFNGSLDGCGFSIVGLYINISPSTYLGLFFGLEDSACISNLTLLDASITGSGWVGSLAGFNSGGTVSNCHVSCTVKGQSAGGLIGYNFGTVRSCSGTGTVNGDGSGGLIGANDGLISDCYCLALVTGTSSVGGLVGSNIWGTVTRCYSTGTVVGGNDVGGFVGVEGSYGATILDCYCSGPVSGGNRIGGFAGFSNGTISRSYSTGKVSAAGINGGFLASDNYGNPNEHLSNTTKCYYDKQTTGCGSSVAGTGKLSAEMRKKATFKGWDFNTVWDITEGKSYPFLRLQSTPSLPVGSWPSWTSIPADQVIAPGTNWSFQVCATDIDPGDILSFRVISTPSCGISIGAATGLLAWSDATYGYYCIRLSVSDGRNAISQGFNLTVSDPPTPTSRAPEILNVSGPSDGITIPSFSLNFSAVASDPDGDSLTIEWRENGATLSRESSFSFDFPVGGHTVVLLIGDGIHLVKRTFNFTVAAEPVPKPVRHDTAEAVSIPAPAIGLSVALVLLVVGMAVSTETGRYALIPLFLPLYTRLHKDELMDNETRGLIRGCILSDPGIHYKAISRRLRLSNGAAAYHLRTLEREGIIRSRTDGRLRRFYPAEMTQAELPVNLTRLQKVIFEILREQEGLSQREIADLMEASYPTIHRHINRMAELGVLRLERRGMTVKCYIANIKDGGGELFFVEPE